MTWAEVAELKKAITTRKDKLKRRLSRTVNIQARRRILSELAMINRKAQELSYTEKVLGEARREASLKAQKERDESDFGLFKKAVRQLDSGLYQRAWELVEAMKNE